MTTFSTGWLALRRTARTCVSALVRATKWTVPWIAALTGALARALFGRVEWSAPVWMRWTAARAARGWRYLRFHPAFAAGVVALALSSAGGYWWYTTRPKPHYVPYIVTDPPLTEWNERGISSIKPLVVTFVESVAPLKQIEKTIATGISMSPPVSGAWFWVNDRTLRFTPADDWPIDGRFTVRVDRNGFLAQGARLEQYTFEFRSRPFTATIVKNEFYQDPVDPNLKKLVATVSFSHPVDPAAFEPHVSLAVAKDAEYLGLTPDSRHFSVIYDKFKLSAYVHSASLAVPRDDTAMTISVDKGVHAARGGNDTTARLESVLTIPGRASLRFDRLQMTVVDNARYEPEQLLLVTSSSPVTERAFASAVTVKLLPERHPTRNPPNQRRYDWRHDSAIGTEILSAAETVPVTYVPSDEGGNTSHGFRFKAPVGRYLHVVIKDGVQGVGGYVSGKPLVQVVKVEPYNRTLKFLGEGSLLPMTGDKQIGFLARDIDNVDVEIARVLPNQLQHIVPQMWNFSRPSMYSNLEDTLAERFTTTRDYSGKEPGKPNYDSVDLGQYLHDGAVERRGLFLLHLRDNGRRRQRPLDEDDDEGSAASRGGPIEDTRLVLVTDLGMIAKEMHDGSRDVFIQSIRTGAPVDGARVALVGNNGVPLIETRTDGSGRARLPRPVDAIREKTPLMIVAQQDADMSFLPLRSDDRRLNFSRFDVGGVEAARSARQLSSYLFSDRGIYRPGETTHLGVITRTADWATALAGLPIDVEVSDPRGTVVSRTSITLSEASFEEVAFTTQPAAPTGTYEAVAYLTSNPRRRETLGSTSFRVQEFEPDRMKARLDLSDGPVDGWLRPTDVIAKMTVSHLFGEPAGNRRVDGELNLSSVLPHFARYPDHRFQIGESLPDPYHERLTNITTDEKGVATFALDLKRFVGRAYRLNLLARAYEAEGGRNVAAESSAIVSDAPYLVGVKADGDLSFVRRTAARSAEWLAVDQKLTPVATDALTLEWVQRKYLSVLTQQGNGTVRYVSRLREVVRDTRSVRIAVGGSRFALPTQEPGDFVLVLRNAAGSELNRLSYTVAGQANVTRSLERNAELQVQLDKPSYSGGDTISVSIRAPYIGAGLITIERERVFQHQWFRTTTTSSVQTITLPAGFEGNGYVNVQFLRDPSSDELFTSPLSYGVAPFSANLDARTQQVTLTAPRTVKPGTTLTLRVVPEEASRVAVLAVDEGVLQVARYQNPNPLGFFFQKRMLEVQTRQILDLILPDFKRFLALAAPGGDADAGFARHLNPFNRKRKAPVAYWSGVVDIGREGRDLKYDVPDYFNGRLRIVAIAANAHKVGVIEADTEVKGDFILTPNVPATTTPGDEFAVSVGVLNNTTGGSGSVRLEAQAGPALSIVSAPGIDLEIADKREAVGEFRVRVNAVLGSADITFVARRGPAESRMDETVSVRPASPYRTELTLGRVDSATAVVPLTRDLYTERRTVEASVSTLPLVWGQALSVYLGNYPYSCTEQLTSMGMSALVLATRPEFGTVRSRDTRPIDSTLGVLRSRENDTGGFGLWASTPDTAEFATVYAAHFLIEAKERGQAVPSEVLTHVNEWLSAFAATPAGTLGDGRMRAYAVYLLVRQGIKPTAALSNVEQELTHRYPQQWTTDLAAAYLASTYRLMQQNDQADRIIRNVPWSPERTDFLSEIYYDRVVHDAQLLYLLSRHFPNRLPNTPSRALETMATAISGNRMTSLSAAYTLLALDAYAGAGTSTATFRVSEFGRDGSERQLPLSNTALPKAPVTAGAARLQFAKQGAAPAYYALNQSGFDRMPPTTGIAKGIEIFRDFLDAAGNVVTKVTVGEEFFVRLRLRTTTRQFLPQVAVVDLLPGGVEAVLELQRSADTSEGVDPAAMQQRRGAARLPIGLTDRSDWSPQHVDLREDRLVLYGDLTGNVATFVYRVRATNAGTYQIPPAFAEGMYDRTIAGLGPVATLEVVKP